MLVVAISALLVLLAAAIDALRIRWRWAATVNIDHGVSFAIGAALAAGQWFVEQPAWHPLAFAIFSVGMRLLFYDPALNLLRRERVDYVSFKTNARTDSWWHRFKIPFWGQRAIGLAALFIVGIIQHYLDAKGE